MTSENTVNIGHNSLRNGRRSKHTLEKFERSLARINTPSWMREKAVSPEIRLSSLDRRTTSDTNNHQYARNEPSSEHQSLPTYDYAGNDDESSYNDSQASEASTIDKILQNEAFKVDKSSSTGRIRYSDYRRACAALAAAVKTRNKSFQTSNATSYNRYGGGGTSNSCDRYSAYRQYRHHTDVLQTTSNNLQTPEEQQLHPGNYAMQRPYIGVYPRIPSRESSPAPPSFPPPPPPPAEMLLSTDSGPASNCLPGYPAAARGRWSTSTLCDSAYSGNNTPTDSVISECKSNISSRSFLHSSSNTTMRQKPYLGWRSQDNLLDSKLSTLSNDPAQRLAYTYKHGVLSGRASVAGTVGHFGAGGSRLARDGGSFGYIDSTARSQSYSRSLPRNCYGSHLTEPLPHSSLQQDQQNELHESIKSVSSAIMEFCKADDVPLPPPDERTKRRQIRTSNQHKSTKVVWMESSFVSEKNPSTTGNNNIQIQVTAATSNNNAPT